MSNLSEFRRNTLLQYEYSLATGRSVQSLLKKAESLHGNTQFNSFLQQARGLDWLEYDESLNANISVIKTVAKSLAELEQGAGCTISEILLELKGKHATSYLDKIFPALESDFWTGFTKGEVMPLLKEFMFWLDYIDELELGEELDSADSLFNFLQQPLFKQVTRLADAVELVPANWELDENVFKNILKGLSATNKDFVAEWLASTDCTSHYNAKSHREYQSLYTWMFLSMMKLAHSYKSPLWATRRQWQKLGCELKEDARPAAVFHYFKIEHEDAIIIAGVEEATSNIGRKISIVYNADEVIGHKGKTLAEHKVTPLPVLERRISQLSIDIQHKNEGPCYTLADDYISMPDKEWFKGKDSTKAYYATLLHEMVHWTGHESRCNRTFGIGEDDPAYAFEELVAEIGSSFLCVRFGLTKNVRQSSIQYILSWLQDLDDNNGNKTLEKAAILANRASSFIYVPKRDN